MKRKFPHYSQMDQMNCGAICLRIILNYYGQIISIYNIKQLCQTTNVCVHLLGISEAAEKLEFRTFGIRLNLDQLKDVELPCILHWNQNLFVVLYRIAKKKYYISDPAAGVVSYDEKEFARNWFSSKEMHAGLSLLLSPSPEFYELEEEESNKAIQWGKIFTYFFKYKRLFFQLIVGILLGTLLQLITPFLTQSVVDIGIYNNLMSDVSFSKVPTIGLVVYVNPANASFILNDIEIDLSLKRQQLLLEGHHLGMIDVYGKKLARFHFEIRIEKWRLSIH